MPHTSIPWVGGGGGVGFTMTGALISLQVESAWLTQHNNIAPRKVVFFKKNIHAVNPKIF